jgi:hypothetical protein
MALLDEVISFLVLVSLAGGKSAYDATNRRLNNLYEQMHTDI